GLAFVVAVGGADLAHAHAPLHAGLHALAFDAAQALVDKTQRVGDGAEVVGEAVVARARVIAQLLELAGGEGQVPGTLRPAQAHTLVVAVVFVGGALRVLAPGHHHVAVQAAQLARGQVVGDAVGRADARRRAGRDAEQRPDGGAHASVAEAVEGVEV